MEPIKRLEIVRGAASPTIFAKLPVTGNQQLYENNFEFNICSSAYAVTVTPIEPGTTPKPA